MPSTGRRRGGAGRGVGSRPLLGGVEALADGLGDLGGLAHAASDAALFIAHDHQGAEAHVAAALDGLGNAVDRDQFFFELADLLVIALH